MTVGDYMQACLHDPEDGYYATRPALGAAGDFITAPLVSQMFGELIAAWAADLWTQLGEPGRLRLVELGPGDGTLMSDVVRAARRWPGFAAAIELLLVETSPVLRARQAERVTGRWIETLADLQPGPPVVILANEFLDCLPIEQAVCAGGVWRERRIGLAADGSLGFVIAEPVDWPADAAPEGAVAERSPARARLAAEASGVVLASGGAALFIDYATDGRGDTLQALSGHRKVSPLAAPGAADLTASVDFTAFLAAAEAPGFGPVSQGAFLDRLGLEARAAALAAAHPERAAQIARQKARLAAPEAMGELFQVVALASAGLRPAGF
jgi:SAM-dependent MidA family methyltransferase